MTLSDEFYIADLPDDKDTWEEVQQALFTLGYKWKGMLRPELLILDIGNYSNVYIRCKKGVLSWATKYYLHRDALLQTIPYKDILGLNPTDTHSQVSTKSPSKGFQEDKLDMEAYEQFMKNL